MVHNSQNTGVDGSVQWNLQIQHTNGGMPQFHSLHFYFYPLQNRQLYVASDVYISVPE